MTDTEIIDCLDTYIRRNNYLVIHNLTGSDDPRWPRNYTGGGLGLTPWNPRTLREALTQMLQKEPTDGVE